MIITQTPFRMSFFGGGTDIAFVSKIGDALSKRSVVDCHVLILMFYSHKADMIISQEKMYGNRMRTL